MDHLQVAIICESLSTSLRSNYAASTQSHPSDVTHNYIWPARESSGFQEDHYPQNHHSSYFQSTHPVKTQRPWRITDTHLNSSSLNSPELTLCWFHPCQRLVMSCWTPSFWRESQLLEPPFEQVRGGAEQDSGLQRTQHQSERSQIIPQVIRSHKR